MGSRDWESMREAFEWHEPGGGVLQGKKDRDDRRKS